MSKFKAFTLAETLITLAIVGIIATLTIPNLYSKYQKHVWVTQLHKCYNRILAGNAVIEREISSVGYPSYNMDMAEFDKRRSVMAEAFANGSGGSFCMYVNFTKTINCQYAKYPNTQNLVKNLNGVTFNEGVVVRDKTFLRGHSVFTYPDGSVIGILTHFPSGGYAWGIHPHPYSFTVDVNGGKGPNQVGRDIFVFVYSESAHTVLPYQNYQVNDTADCTTSGAGETCSRKIMEDGWKMNY